MTGSLRIMTWNVHGTFNLNPKFDLDGVCSLIRQWAPDVVALQEVDSRGRNDDPFMRLAEAVGDHRIDARSIVTKDGDYGQALFSRWPFVEPPEVVDVSYREREPRFLAHRPGLDPGAYAVGLDGGGVSRPTKRNLRSILCPVHEHGVRDG